MGTVGTGGLNHKNDEVGNTLALTLSFIQLISYFFFLYKQASNCSEALSLLYHALDCPTRGILGNT